MLKQDKALIIKQFAQAEGDTGSSEVQIGLLTNRIAEIARHLESFPKDNHSRAGLLKLVGKRRTLADYLKKTNIESHDRVMQMVKTKKA